MGVSMLKLINQTIENMVVYLVLVAILMNLLGNTTYKRYIQIFSGIVLMLIVLNPILQLLKWDGVLDFHILSSELTVSNVEMQKEMALVEGEQKKRILLQYKKEVEEQVKQLASLQEIEVVTCMISVSEAEESFGEIESIALTCKEKEEDLEESGKDGIKNEKRNKEEENEKEILIEKVERIQIQPIEQENTSYKKQQNEENQMLQQEEQPEQETVEAFAKQKKELFLQEESNTLKKEVQRLYGIEKDCIQIVWKEGDS